jgi:CBS domain-containing protein
MTTDVLTAKARTTLSDIADLMIEKRIDALPIIGEKGQLVGIITSSDLLRVISRRKIHSDNDPADLDCFSITTPWAL